MKTQSKSEKGQAIVMIAFAIVGMLALVALALDGGHAFSDRRQAQNAADAAALAAAMKYAHDQSAHPESDLAYYRAVALASTTANGYDGTPTRSDVALTILRHATADECPAIAFTPVPGLVFQVDVDSYLPTWFGPVIGVSQVHNHVTSTSLSCPPYRTVAFSGNAIVTLHRTAPRAMEFAGSSTTHVTSSTAQGLYIRSNYVDGSMDIITGGGSQSALYMGGGNMIAPRVNVVGNIYNPGNIILNPAPVSPQTRADFIKTGVPPIDDSYIWPDVGDPDVCPAGTPQASRTANNSDTLNPGVYPGTTFDSTLHDWHANTSFPPNGITHLRGGIYCLDNDFQISTGALNNILNPNTNVTGITLIMRDGQIKITGGDIQLSATTTGRLQGLLFYMPYSNPNSRPNTIPPNNLGIDIQGSGASSYSGSIVAPGAKISITGSSGTNGPFQTQLVGDTIHIGGSGDLYLNFDAAVQYRPPVSASIQLFK